MSKDGIDDGLDDGVDIGKNMDEKAIPNKEEREKVNKMMENPIVKTSIKNNSSVDGLNQANTPNNDLEPGISTVGE